MLRQFSIRRCITSHYLCSLHRFNNTNSSPNLYRYTRQQQFDNQMQQNKLQFDWEDKDKEINESIRTQRWRAIAVALTAFLLSLYGFQKDFVHYLWAKGFHIGGARVTFVLFSSCCSKF